MHITQGVTPEYNYEIEQSESLCLHLLKNFSQQPIKPSISAKKNKRISTRKENALMDSPLK